MWKQISKNKRNSIFIFILLSLILLSVGAISGFILMDTSVEGAIWGGIIVMFIYWALIMDGQRKSLPISVDENVRKCKKNDNPKLYNIVEEMAIAAGLSVVPDIYIMDTSEPNAFACGFKPEKSCVCVTTGLLELCNRDELQGVVAHELAHIVNRDTTYLLYASIIVAMLSSMTRAFSRGGRRRSSSNGSVIIVLMLLLSYLFANLLYFFLSRKREFLADACAAQFTRYPVGLASALKKITSSTKQQKDLKGESQLKLNPYVRVSCITPVISSFLGLFSTHPSTEDRIKILMSMTNGADFATYNMAYSSVTKKSGVINNSDVQACEKTPIRIGEPMVALVSLVGGKLTPEIMKIEQDEKVERRRQVEDMMWRYEGYIFVECTCETKLKLPQSFKGKTVVCPHCKSEHIIS